MQSTDMTVIWVIQTLVGILLLVVGFAVRYILNSMNTRLTDIDKKVDKISDLSARVKVLEKQIEKIN